MNTNPINVKVSINADLQKVWDYYTLPQHITQWNFADPSWHCPSASNDLQLGGKYSARMEARDGSFGFDFEATYTYLNTGESFSYEFGGRNATITFKNLNGQTELSVTFEPETENPRELQQKGWQSILDNFKKYTEGEGKELEK
jgi:uncharacterized protein YndB with AHSA1/START domain